MDSLVLFAHVLAAIVLVASSLLAPLVRHAIQAAGSLAELRQWLDLGRRAARGNPLAALALLGTGVYLGSDGWWVEAWFWVAIGAWLVNATLAALVVKRTAAAVAVAASRAGAGPVPDAVDLVRRSPAWGVAEGVMGANDLALLYVMIDKPTLVESLALLGLANLALFSARFVRGRVRRDTQKPRASQVAPASRASVQPGMTPPLTLKAPGWPRRQELSNSVPSSSALR